MCLCVCIAWCVCFCACVYVSVFMIVCVIVRKFVWRFLCKHTTIQTHTHTRNCTSFLKSSHARVWPGTRGDEAAAVGLLLQHVEKASKHNCFNKSSSSIFCRNAQDMLCTGC